MRVLIDTNVVLDFLQGREPFVENAARLIDTRFVDRDRQDYTAINRRSYIK